MSSIIYLLFKTPTKELFIVASRLYIIIIQAYLYDKYTLSCQKLQKSIAV